MRCVHFLLKRAREIRKFHVIIVERWLRNLQKSVMLVQSCFANIYRLLFCRSRCRRRRRCLSFLLFWFRNFATMVTWHHSSVLYSESKSILQQLQQCYHASISMVSEHSFCPLNHAIRYTSSAGHISSPLPLNWCNVSDRQCPLPLVPLRISLCVPFCLRFMGSIFLSSALCADLSLYFTHSGFF